MEENVSCRSVVPDPFFSDKYDITKHKNYRLLADENEKNRYKVEKELNPQYTPKSEEEVEVIHVELVGVTLGMNRK